MASVGDRLCRYPAVSVAVVVGLVYCLSPAVMVGDSRMSLPTAVSIVRSADMTLDEFDTVQALRTEYDVVERDGRLYMGYPWPPTLFLVPVVALADLVPSVDPAAVSLSSPNRTWIYEVPVAAALMAVAVALFFAAARDAAGRASADVLVATGALAFGTVWWSSASRALSQHAAAAPFVALALYLLSRSRRDDGAVPWLGAAVAGAYVMRPSAAVLVAVVTGWVVVAHRRRLAAYLARAAIVAVPFVAVNLVAYGALLPPYYSADKVGGTSEPLVAALGLFVSPSRGLLWYSPIVVLSLVGVAIRARRRQLDAVDAVIGLTVAGMFAVVAAWPNWWGGSSYGPRLLAETMPFACWYLVPAFEGLRERRRGRARLLVAGYAVVGAAVLANAQGALMRASVCWNSVPSFVDSAPQRLWDWSDPQVLRAARDLSDGASLRQVVIGSCKDAGGMPVNGG